MTDYLQDERLAPYIWEESYALSITAQPALLTISLDLALRVTHPLHETPLPGERHCYKRALLEFSQVRNLSWSGQGAVPAVDITGERDFGTIESFEVDDDTYVLIGDFGHIFVAAAHMVVTLDRRRGS